MTCAALITPLVAGQVPDPERFHQMHPDGRRAIQEWRERAFAEESRGPEHWPLALIFGWLGFNGWAMCVTKADDDAGCIRHLAADTTLANRFADLRRNAAFAAAADHFSALWPVLSSKHYRKLMGDPFAADLTPERVNEYTRLKGAKFEPRCHPLHVNAGTRAASDWAHTIRAIYQIRCNLLHGEKTTHLPRDRELIAQAGWLLLRTIDGELGQPPLNPLF